MVSKMDTGCDYCDEPGGEKTYKNQVKLPLKGRVRCIDYCIHHIVAALNAGGIHTIQSCCGHKKADGVITLEDGRMLVIKEDPNAGKYYPIPP